MKKNVFQCILIILLLAIPVISSPDFDGSLSVFRSEPFQRDFVRFILIIVFFYFNLLFLLPKFFRKKNYFAVIVAIVMSYSVIVFLPFVIIPNHQNQEFVRQDESFRRPNFEPVDKPPMMLHKEDKPPHNHFEDKKDNTIVKKIFTSLLPFLFSLLSSFYIYKSVEKRDLEKSKAKAELLNLRYQLQPHFLFNILNSIYSLSLIKSDDAPNSILKLSNVMRFVVQESSNDFVDLYKEIEYLKDYIELQLIRIDESLDFSFIENGDYKNLKIAPFILIIFVENAFKYGYNAEEISKISINIDVREKTLHFSIQNNIVNKNIKSENSFKIGLKNTLEHLQQLYFNKHKIAINEENDIYKVDLVIDLG